MTAALTRAVLLRRAVWRALDTHAPILILNQLVVASAIAASCLRGIDAVCYQAWLEYEASPRMRVVNWSVA